MSVGYVLFGLWLGSRINSMKLIQLLALQHIEPIKDPSKTYEVDSANQTFTEYKAATLKPHLHGRLFCNAIRRFFMRENLSRKAVTHTRQDSLAAIAFGKNRCRVSNTCDLRCRLYFCATRCNNRSRP